MGDREQSHDDESLDDTDKGLEETSEHVTLLKISPKRDQTKEEALADSFMDSVVQCGITTQRYSWGFFTKLDINQLIKCLSDQTNEISDGNLDCVESLLVAQANTLSAMFNSLAQKGAQNIYTNFEPAEKLIKLALRAQSQCRSTLDTLVKIKSPPASGVVKQTNIAHGPQQVNNNPPKAEELAENENPPNELLEKKERENWLDGGSPKEAIRADSDMETVAEIHGTKVT